jgi:hypothetical protein
MSLMEFESSFGGGFGETVAPLLVAARLIPTSRRILRSKGDHFHSSRPWSQRGGRSASRWSPWHGVMEVSLAQVVPSPAPARRVPVGSRIGLDRNLLPLFEVFFAICRVLFVIVRVCGVLLLNVPHAYLMNNWVLLDPTLVQKKKKKKGIIAVHWLGS